MAVRVETGSEEPVSREFAFSDADFRMLAQAAYEEAGIALSEAKRNLVYGRLSRRLRALGLNSFAAYREYLAQNRDEVQNFINAISTNLTKFFRESHHFRHFHEAIAAPYAASFAMNPAARLRIWSAGCSTGEEPYSIASVLRRCVRNASADARILATDIDTEVLKTGARGDYAAESLSEIPRVFHSFFAKNEARVQAGDEIRDLIRFRHLNLINDWPFRGTFDAIFCRNVMIYFDAPTKAALLNRFAERLKPGGWLYIGHSESLTRSHPYLELEGKTIYRRRA